MDKEIRLQDEYFNVYTQCDVVDGGYTEDGEKFYFDCWYVVMTHESGRRWINLRSFIGYDINEVKREVEEHCAFVIERLKKEDWSLSAIEESEFWRETVPAYGSDAYQKQGSEKELIEFERKQYLA
jgi:hypothetical protein